MRDCINIYEKMLINDNLSCRLMLQMNARAATDIKPIEQTLSWKGKPSD